MSQANNVRFVWSVAITLAAITLAVWPIARAHHSPSAVIEVLTERIIEAGERTATLFVRRGDQYRAIANDPSAAADYESALKIQPGNLSALHGLVRVRFRQQRFDDAIEVSHQGIAAARNPDEAGPFHAILARTYEQQEQWGKSLAAWNQSLAVSHPNINSYLGESRALTELNRHDDARRSLAAAIERNPSVVLRRAWIKTLIDCGAASEASQHIEAGLARARWKSSWLLLRARLNQSQDQLEAAQLDAASALQEINTRLKPNVDNPWLADDREQALAILTKQN